MRTPRTNLSGQQIHECDFCDGEVEGRSVYSVVIDGAGFDACPDCFEEDRVSEIPIRQLTPSSLADFVEATLQSFGKGAFERISQDLAVAKEHRDLKKNILWKTEE